MRFNINSAFILKLSRVRNDVAQDLLESSFVKEQNWKEMADIADIAVDLDVLVSQLDSGKFDDFIDCFRD